MKKRTGRRAKKPAGGNGQPSKPQPFSSILFQWSHGERQFRVVHWGVGGANSNITLEAQSIDATGQPAWASPPNDDATFSALLAGLLRARLAEPPPQPDATPETSV